MQQIKRESVEAKFRIRPRADVGNLNIAPPAGKSRLEDPSIVNPARIRNRLLPPNSICLLAMLQLSFIYELDEGHALLSPFHAASRAEVT